MKRSSFTNKIVWHALAVVMVSVFFGIFATPAHMAASSQNTSYVRVIHASPYVGTADVFVDGSKLLSSFQFASVTDYVPIPEGTHRVQIALVGKGIGAAALSQDLPVAAGYTYTIAALGATPDTLSLKVFQDNNQVAPGRAKVRVYHLAPDASGVNINIGEDAKLNNVGYPKASDYYTVDTGPCTFDFTNIQSNISLPLTKDLLANTVTSVFAVGLFSGNPKVQLVAAQTPGIPGLPGTGADPKKNPIDSVTSQPLTQWLFGAVALCLVLAGGIVRMTQMSSRRWKRVA